MDDNKLKIWLERIFFIPMCCDFLRSIGVWIAEDKSLTENDRAILRQHWQDKFKACRKAKLITYEDADRMIGVEVSSSIKKEYTYANIGAKTLKERRALFLLSSIEKHYNLPETFNIANLSMKIVGSIYGRELKSPQNTIGGVCQDKKIYLDRKLLKLADFSVKTWNTSHIGAEDMPVDEDKIINNGKRNSYPAIMISGLCVPFPEAKYLNVPTSIEIAAQP